ncbi:MAG: 5-formyltetrahydrofolate cyclo-ligase [Clostridia bacterium]|nr:5-formyltetrahydrofolate cyclo-ligase [Clostridiales bacterium]MBQ3506673.1 5-formyltetrahydrofolate cyclo-ligase [Clostridia bacterium]
MTTNRLRFVTGEEDIAMRKKNLRAYMKEKRGENENRDGKETQMLENLFSERAGLIQKGETKKWFVYLSFSSEARTDLVIERLLELGQEVFCPRVDGKDMYAVRYGEDFSLSKYGVREPVGEIYNGEMDIVILPMLAVDGQGNRLGYGGGYYDKWLAAHPNCKRVAFVFDMQLLKEVPSEETDQKMDMIITDKQVLFVKEI